MKKIKRSSSKIDKIYHVLNNKIKNIHPNLLNDLIKDVLNNDKLNNINEIYKYIVKKLNIICSSIHSYSYWINRGWSKKEIIKKRPKLKVKHSPMQIENWINKINPITNMLYTKDEAIFKIKSQRKTNKEYWLNLNYNENESNIKVSEFQKELSKKFTDNLKNNPNNARTSTQIQYWLNKNISIEEAKLLLKKRQQTVTLNNFIKLYGEEEGKIRRNNYINKIKYAVSLQYYIDKYGIDEGRLKYSKKFNNTKRYKSSYEAFKFFIPIYKFLRFNNISQSDIYWGVGKSNEYFIYNNDINNKYKIFFYDFTIPKLNIIIEYNGITFHPNPSWCKKDLEKWKNPFTNENHINVLNKDEYKKNIAINKGFNVYEIYSDDNIKNKQNEIIEILKNKLLNYGR